MLTSAFRMLIIGILATSLAGCMTEERYEAASAALQGSASLRAKTIDNCIRRDWNAKSLEAAALILDVPESKAARLACQRSIDAIASGKLTYEDVAKAQRGNITAKVVRVMQGR
jgi:hypothetical protein